MASKKVSVRALVEFTLRAPDIMPTSLAAMEEGRKGHTAVQARAEARAEVPLALDVTAHGMDFCVSGRMDLFDDAQTPPRIEEIKLSGERAPQEAQSAHWAQAEVYGHIVCQSLGYDRVCLCVRYVSVSGETRAAFEQTEDANALAGRFDALLQPYAEYASVLEAHRAARDDSLRALPFPYASYRPGQREMAAQAYIAVSRKKRLFATLPTGTGKSAAALYPVLKAMGEGKTRQVFYLTARTTARQAALDALDLMRTRGMRARALTLAAKEKCCPYDEMRCNPIHCERACGHYLREHAGILDMPADGDWRAERVREVADRHLLCPFEFSLSLCEVADVVICDYNYAFDPLVYLQRVFGHGGARTLLVDEAHNLPSRVRDMLSGTLDARELTAYRRALAKLSGRRGKGYAALTAAIRLLKQPPDDDAAYADALLDASDGMIAGIADGSLQPPGMMNFLRTLLKMLYACRSARETPGDYRVLRDKYAVKLLCLNITDHLRAMTAKMTGCVFFSATLFPLARMRTLLGGGEDDACFSLPSPFPPEHLLTVTMDIDTRYHARARTAGDIARAIVRMARAHRGNYIVFFPSYAYLLTVAQAIAGLPDAPLLSIQERSMTDPEREAFLARFTPKSETLALCVMGGVFGEGVDLPGDRLVGVCVVGVGLPQVNPEQEALRAYYDDAAGGGFAQAYQYPGMHKVWQAAGRVIRSETDRGVVLLLDARYASDSYAALTPEHIRPRRARNIDELNILLKEFWHTVSKESE